MLVHSAQHLAAVVSDQRKKLKISQMMVGDQVGLKQATVSAFENKPDNTRLETLFRILSALDLELHVVPKKELTPSKTEW